MRRQGELDLRRATDKDARDLWRWRNDTLARTNSFDSRKITLPEHAHWLRKSLRSRSRRIYIAIRKKKALGVVRFDFLSPKLVTVSINLAPEFRGKGYGKLILRKASDFMFRKYPGYLQKALIKRGNRKSKKIFASAGFLEIHKAEGGYSIWIRKSH